MTGFRPQAAGRIILGAVLIFILVAPTFVVSAALFYNKAQETGPTHAWVPRFVSRVPQPIQNQVDVPLTAGPQAVPVGMADFGVGPSGGYEYNTTQFLGTAYIGSLLTRNVTGELEEKEEEIEKARRETEPKLTRLEHDYLELEGRYREMQDRQSRTDRILEAVAEMPEVAAKLRAHAKQPQG